MDLYIIEAPDQAPQIMTVGTDAAKTARERGGTCNSLTVPDTKKDFVPWFNGFVGGLYSRTRTTSSAAPSPLRAAEHPIRDTSPAAADSISPRDMIRLINEDRTSDAVARWIGGQDGWRLGVVIDACLARLNRLRVQLVEKGN